jgi:hypothetical protein
MLEIKAPNGNTLAKHIPAAEAWGQGLKFFSQDADFIQVGTWGYDQGKALLAHSHNHVPREVTITQETLYIRKGSLLAEIYDRNDQKTAEIEAREGDILVLLGGGHGYRILEEGTQVLEIKNGPYLGPDTDRRRL